MYIAATGLHIESTDVDGSRLDYIDELSEKSSIFARFKERRLRKLYHLLQSLKYKQYRRFQILTEDAVSMGRRDDRAGSSLS